MDKNLVQLTINIDTYESILTVSIDDKIEADVLDSDETLEVLEELLNGKAEEEQWKPVN